EALRRVRVEPLDRVLAASLDERQSQLGRGSWGLDDQHEAHVTAAARGVALSVAARFARADRVAFGRRADLALARGHDVPQRFEPGGELPVIEAEESRVAELDEARY